ncbi:MAG: TM0106 family RecB-like putative nuclease [Syntrophales bacterium LBB04]|nr:TM0106 family RecB-like putative nuclease [Syntrophales bacterium LBB04]
MQWQYALNCVVSAHSWKSHLDAVEWNRQSKHGKSFYLIPVRFVHRNKVTIEDKLLVAFDALVLAGMTRRKIQIGKLIYGSEYRCHTVTTSLLINKVRRQIEQINHCISESKTPDLILSRRCTDCEFQISCRKEAIEKDDLSLLAGMTEKERRKLNGKGIFTVTQLSYTFRPRRRPKRLVSKNEKYYQALKALAIREHKIHVVGKPELNISGTPVYLDVEGMPERDLYFLIGVRIPTADGFIQRSFWADSDKDEKQIWESFLGLLASVDNPILIHYGSFETIFLKRMIMRYGCPTNDALSKAIDNPVNLLSVIYARIYFPTYSNSLKDLAKFLDFKWSEPNVSGVQAIVWRHEWEKAGNPALKQKLIEYNAEDCEGLQRVTDFIVNLSIPYEASTNPDTNDIVHAESLPRNDFFKFRKIEFCLPEFEKLNQAAYWDYQREKILVKSNNRIRNIEGKWHKQKFNRPRINKSIYWPAPSHCPKCSGSKVYKHWPTSKMVLDVKFTSSGIKRWVLKYYFYHYRCPECSAVFQNSERDWGSEKFGPNLMALSVYANIELGLSQGRVTTFLNQVFNFSLSRGVTNKLKAKAATFYKDTHEGLVRRIVRGRLVQADETKVNLKPGIGYVWAFTNLEEVAYIYAPSREGDLVHSLLKDFKGVLVSDFYTADDSLDCPQQKCLIHLIRDFNNEMLKEPFNQELKEVASDFAGLLKPIIETVDRFGLKTRFIRKHKVFVDRFFRGLARRDYQTETAIKCKKRIEKNRNTLFTFLDYDNVPWNNNAEHAIKAFALMRRNFSGVTTEKGIREYLVLLSICETCRFKGINFLDFLRSGEKDIDLFATLRK